MQRLIRNRNKYLEDEINFYLDPDNLSRVNIKID